MKIYTRTGDTGTTGLFGGERIPKDSLAVESYGSVDELTSALGVLLTVVTETEEKKFVVAIQKNLYNIMGALAHAPTDLSSCKSHIALIEQKIDSLSESLPELHSFIIPGGSPASAWSHLCRTICRRAERSVIRFYNEQKVIDQESSATVIQYLNRLSDLLFTYARHFNKQKELNAKQ